MFRHLLVPLDGSELAEAVLPMVELLAGGLHASVTLLHVLERRPPSQVHGERHLASVHEAREYLDGVQRRLQQRGLTVSCHVHEVAEGDVARSIVAHSEELENDLVVLATHGRGGVRGMLFGSIAQQVLGSGTRPVLVIHPQPPQAGGEPQAPGPGQGQAEPVRLRRIGVPLDGAAHHVPSVPVAVELARRLGAAVFLVTVVPHPRHLAGGPGMARRFLPLATAARLQLQAREAQAALEQLARRESAGGVEVRTAVRRGEPVAELVRYFREQAIDLAVVATHALKGWTAFWEGSLTPRLLSQWRGPALLVRVSQQASP